MKYRNEQSVYSNRVILLVTLPLVFLLVNKKTCSQSSFPAQHYFSIRHDNDFLNLAGQGTDRYYSSGIYIQYSFLSPAHGSVMNKTLFSPHPLSPSFFTIGITQWMYTPANLKSPVIVKGDYPYAGILFFHFSRENLFTSKQLFRSELWLGMMGP